jgi:hypothetical protein
MLEFICRVRCELYNHYNKNDNHYQLKSGEIEEKFFLLFALSDFELVKVINE